jgi:hypothetical protein
VRETPEPDWEHLHNAATFVRPVQVVGKLFGNVRKEFGRLLPVDLFGGVQQIQQVWYSDYAAKASMESS